MTFVVSAAFGLLGLLMLLHCIQSLRARRLVSGTAHPELEDEVRRCLDRSGLIAFAVGCTLMLASVSAWWNLPVALVLGGWPIVLFALMALTGNVEVISRVSAGSTDEES